VQATCCGDGSARVWDAATGESLGAPLTHQDAVRSAAFSPDGTRVVTASLDKTARMWEIPLDDTPWGAVGARCPFVVINGAIEQRVALPT